MKTERSRVLVDIGELRGRQEPLRLQARFSDQDLKIRSQILRFSEPASATLTVSAGEGGVRVEGKLNASLELTCSRCLTRFVRRVEKRFDLEYRQDPEVSSEAEEFSLTYTDLAIGFYRNDQLDLDAVVAEQILLEVPMKPVCQEGCRGLCDQCGSDLNEGPCGCERRSGDPRLAVLSELKKRLNGRTK
ncbi:MAG: DUF177 domain-containing protein [Acidobacteriota bacterium]